MSFPKNPAESIRLFEAHDHFGALMGGRVVSLTAEECVYEYEVSPRHYNPNGILHGGALYSVMDSSQGLFVHLILEDTYKAAATGTAIIKYMAPLTEGKVRIRSWLKGRERRKLFVSSCATDESGQEVATLDEIWIAIPK